VHRGRRGGSVVLCAFAEQRDLGAGGSTAIFTFTWRPSSNCTVAV